MGRRYNLRQGGRTLALLCHRDGQVLAPDHRWSISQWKDLSLTMSALNHAVLNRPEAKAVIFHTDRGSEYGAQAIQQRLADLGFIQSMNRPGGKLTDNVSTLLGEIPRPLQPIVRRPSFGRDIHATHYSCTEELGNP